MMRLFKTSFVTSVIWRLMIQKDSPVDSSAEAQTRRERGKRWSMTSMKRRWRPRYYKGKGHYYSGQDWGTLVIEGYSVWQFKLPQLLNDMHKFRLEETSKMGLMEAPTNWLSASVLRQGCWVMGKVIRTNCLAVDTRSKTTECMSQYFNPVFYLLRQCAS